MYGLASAGGASVSTGGTGSYSGGLKATKSQPIANQADDFVSCSDIMFADQMEFSIVDPNMIQSNFNDAALRQMVWDRLIPLVKYHLLFNPERVTDHNKAVMEDVVKSS